MCTNLVVQQEHRHDRSTCVLALDFSCHLSEHCKPAPCRTLSGKNQWYGTDCRYIFFSFHLSSFFSPWGAEIVVNCLQERPSELPSLVSTEYYCSLTLAWNTGGESGWFRSHSSCNILFLKMHHSIKMIQPPPEDQRVQRENTDAGEWCCQWSPAVLVLTCYRGQLAGGQGALSALQLVFLAALHLLNYIHLSLVSFPQRLVP